MDENHVTICFLENRGEVLFRRSDGNAPCSGRWNAVAGRIEGDSEATARETIAEETGLTESVSLVRSGEPFAVEDREARWRVHPSLFECDSRAVETTDETAEYEWVSSPEIRRRETVPGLWRAYERCAPTVEGIGEDTDHGSAWLSVRALSVLRDRAGVLATTGEHERETGGWADLAALARDLRSARPSMVAIANRIDRAMAAVNDERTPKAVERTTREGIERAFAADERAAREAAALVDGTVLTLSRSGTVIETLRRAEVGEIIVCESRPALEGVGVAEELAADCSVTLAADAAAAHLLATRAIDAVLVGADTLFPDGSVSNKVGTRGISLAAANEGVPVYAVAASDKVATDAEADVEEGDDAVIYDGDGDIAVANPTFDCTPPEAVNVVTERGVLDPSDIAALADELDALAAWSRGTETESG